ncbi:hypothetical protein AMAG_12399 [Allomyces macrogynus ATCC 38327]|uniref:Tectonic-1-3 domain-containing protein n=1 Tax=Allomyces macrogynus (strain ATCC 38327) TaxID=578462 RepID=A0A0L0SYN6_ALLM3|nr:hypothetical protein AMAG_12399 [Allomyces macrogynus ATCC 38327]|eukprot:KNE67663.1 hypothetical protein AMAG_12399 [Allomyces macrogynus ATCC 38327]
MAIQTLLKPDGSRQGQFYVPRARGPPSSSSACIDSAHLAFLNSSASSCTRDLSSPSSACAANSTLDISIYAGLADITSDPSIPSSSAPVVLRQPWSCPTRFQVNGACCIGGCTSTVDRSTIPAPNLVGSTCRTVVTDVHYSIEYAPAVSNSARFRIRQVVVDWAIADVVAVTTVGNRVVEQTFAATFVNVSGTTSLSAPTQGGLANVQVRSGSPGFHFGSPILAWDLSWPSSPTLAPSDWYWSLPTTDLTTGQCSSTSSSSPHFPSDVAALHPTASLLDTSSPRFPRPLIRFATDTESACALTWTPGSTTTCATIRAYLGSVLSRASSVARFGNITTSPTAAPSDWLPVTVAAAPPASAAPDTPTTCPLVATQLDLDFAWADAGNAAKPEPMIVGVRAAYGRVRSLGEPVSCTTPATCAQLAADMAAGNTGVAEVTVPMMVRVRWSRITPERVAAWVPPPPALFPPVPSDWFYPFA